MHRLTTLCLNWAENRHSLTLEYGFRCVNTAQPRWFAIRHVHFSEKLRHGRVALRGERAQQMAETKGVSNAPKTGQRPRPRRHCAQVAYKGQVAAGSGPG